MAYWATVRNKRFLNILNAGIRKNEDYHKVPLPFKLKHIKIPNSRSQALKRTRKLEKKIKKDGSLFEDYHCFIYNFETMGFSIKATAPLTDDSNLYLPRQ